MSASGLLTSAGKQGPEQPAGMCLQSYCICGDYCYACGDCDKAGEVPPDHARRHTVSMCLQSKDASTCCVTCEFSTGQASTVTLQHHGHITSHERITMWGSSDGTM